MSSSLEDFLNQKNIGAGVDFQRFAENIPSAFAPSTIARPVNGPLPGSKPTSGGFFDHIEKATQSPLFGLGIGLLSGDPQQGFSNARALSRDKNSKVDKEELERVLQKALITAGGLSEQAAKAIVDNVLSQIP